MTFPISCFAQVQSFIMEAHACCQGIELVEEVCLVLGPGDVESGGRQKVSNAVL
jgi:hypothetical protein